MSSAPRDLFIIHTRSDRRQTLVYEFLYSWCQRVELTVTLYDDWEWAPANDPEPDFFGRMPSDPWLYMPEINTEKLRWWWQTSDVVLIVESHPNEKHSLGVSIELSELLRFSPSGMPPAVVLATSFESAASEGASGLAAAFLRISTPEDAALPSFVSVAWVVSRLQRSGWTGMNILEAAQAACPRLRQFSYYGPAWRDVPLLAKPSRYKVTSWWPLASELDAHVRAHNRGPFVDAWVVVADQIEGWLSRGAPELT